MIKRNGIANAAKKVGGGIVGAAKTIGGGVVKIVEKAAPIIHKVGDVIGNVAGIAAKGAALLGQPEFAAPLLAVSKGAHAVGNVAGQAERVVNAAKHAGQAASRGDFAGAARHAASAVQEGRATHQMARGAREDVQFGRHAIHAMGHRGREMYEDHGRHHQMFRRH